MILYVGVYAPFHFVKLSAFSPKCLIGLRDRFAFCASENVLHMIEEKTKITEKEPHIDQFLICGIGD